MVCPTILTLHIVLCKLLTTNIIKPKQPASYLSVLVSPQELKVLKSNKAVNCFQCYMISNGTITTYG